jgi:hypothetical protein
MCLLMLLWFVSGVVMLFVGYPKLTPWERLAALPPLPEQACCIAPEAALPHSPSAETVSSIVLTSIRGQPHYVLTEGHGRQSVIDARSGLAGPPATAALALAEARAFLPGAGADYAGTIGEDRWTHARALDPHRPLHVVEMRDAASTRLFISSATGQVLLDAPLGQRLWNYGGAWLHWLYMFRDRPVDPVWSWTVIILSGIGVITALTGLLNGIWRWRFTGRYKNGTKSPFRETALRLHHMFGLGFGLILCTWIFSGLMSMNPLGIFDAKGLKPDSAAYRHGSPVTHRPGISVPAALSLLAGRGFHASELEWRVLNGQPFILARASTGATRLLVQSDTGVQVMDRWPDIALLAAAKHLLPAPIVAHQTLDRYDAYYYKRETPSMYGGHERRLSALRIVYGDPESTWVHLDVHTGDIELSMDRSQRLGRWLFNLLHSWDVPALLHAGWTREALLALLSIGGMFLSLTGIVIGTRRLRKRALAR